MKTAKEILEKIGYHLIKQTRDTQHLIEYHKTNNYGETQIIIFDTSARTISKYLKTDYKCEGHRCEGHGIFINELKAINKQVEELGWWYVKD